MPVRSSVNAASSSFVDFGLMAHLQSPLIRKHDCENDTENEKSKHGEEHCTRDKSLLRVAETHKGGLCDRFVRFGTLVDRALNMIEHRSTAPWSRATRRRAEKVAIPTACRYDPQSYERGREYATFR